MFEQMMIQQQELYRQAQENRQKMIDQKYPVNFVIGHSVLLAAVCLALVVLQIMMIINQNPLYYIGTGIWVAGFFIILISLELILSKYIKRQFYSSFFINLSFYIIPVKYRNYCLFTIVFLMNTFGMVLAIGS